MRHNTLTLIFSILILNTVLTAQNSNWRILGGIKNVSSWQGSQSYTVSDIDIAWNVQTTSPISAQTFSILYSHSFHSKWSWSLGLNINQKGYREKGIFNDIYEPTSRPYNQEITRPYWGLLIGSQYQFYNQNSWACSAELLFNPEAEKYGYEDAKKWGLSTILMLNIDKKISQRWAISCSPLFESSLINYFKKEQSTQYNPLGYGITLGLKYCILP